MIYFDNVRATQPSPKVIAMLHSLSQEHWQSLLAPYIKSESPFDLIKKSQESIHTFLGASKKSPFYLTSSAAQGFNEVLQAICLGSISETGKKPYYKSSD